LSWIIQRAPLPEGKTPRDIIIELEIFTSRLNEYINELAARWHLTDNWCWQLLFQIAMFGQPVRHFAKIEKSSFQFEDEGWDYTTVPYAQFEDRILAQVKQKLSEYRINAENEAAAHGLPKTTEKRERVHYRWLARYQVKGESATDIWGSLQNGEKRATPRAIQKAIHDTAESIGLTLRQTRVQVGLPSCELRAQPS
jgi:hypothetical protein